MHRSYKKLKEIFQSINHINNIISILNWDTAVIMPKGSIDARSEQLAYLTELAHKKINDPCIEELLNQSEELNLDDWNKRNLSLMKKNYLLAKMIPIDLAKSISIATSKSEMAWRDAKKNNDYKSCIPHLKEVLNLSKQSAQIKSKLFGLEIYDAMLDSFEPEFTSQKIDVIFDDLKKFLPSFIDQVIKHQESKVNTNIQYKLDIDKQKAIGRKLMQLMGFNFNKGRLDISEHPFCGGIVQDLRITTRYNENNFISGIMGIIHETGHALYEQNLPHSWLGQPIASAQGMATHESQSLIWEYKLGRSKKFLSYLSQMLEKDFGLIDEYFDVETLYNQVNKVSRSFIRVEADEVTYPAHVILRYEIEKLLIREDLDLGSLPEVWNQKMEELLGVKPKNDAEGCLQDIHWPMGAFGYFPFYLIGAISATKLHNAYGLQTKNKDLSFGELREWLKINIHQNGSRYNLQELLSKSTGSDLSVDVYKKYLQDKFLA